MSKALELSRVIRGRGIASDLGPFRNKLINGGFVLNQRVTYPLTIAPGENKFVCDRFRIFNNTNQTLTVTRGAVPVGFNRLPYHLEYFLGITCPAVATGSFYLTQNIEGVRTLSDHVATKTVYAASDAAGSSLKIYAEQRFGTGGSPNVANVFKDYTAIPSGGGSGWAKFTGAVKFSSANGKTEGANSSIHDVVEVRPRAAGAIYLTCLSLVDGDATQEDDPFSPRSLQQEISLCQRYFWKLTGSTSWLVGHKAAGSGSVRRFAVQLPEVMRVTPSISVIGDASVFTTGGVWTAGVLSASFVSNILATMSVADTTTPTAEYTSLVRLADASGVAAVINFDAEL